MTTQVHTLASWLLEQIEEDEARAAAFADCRVELLTDHGCMWSTVGAVHPHVLTALAAHRTIVGLHKMNPTDDDPSKFGCRICDYDGDCSWQHESDEPGGCDTLRALALAYADRGGFREEWRA